MSKEILCSLDSLPMSKTIFDCFDYSGIQYHGLSATPLAMKIESISYPNEKTMVLNIQKSYWNSGKEISSEDYLRGIHRCGQLNPQLLKTYFRSVKSIKAEPSKLVFHLVTKNYSLKFLFGLHIFCPLSKYAENSSSGPYVSRSTEGSFVFDPNPSYQKDHSVLRLKHIKDPFDNLTLFHDRKLDITSDTAFPFKEVSKYKDKSFFRSSDCGLKMSFVFGSNLQSFKHLSTRRFLAKIINSCSFSSIFFVECGRLHAKEGLLQSHVKARKLTIAYDPYYPNLEVCQIVVDKLNALGWPVQLVQDNYRNPEVVYDLKFTILRTSSVFLEVFEKIFHRTVTPFEKQQQDMIERLYELDLLDNDEDFYDKLGIIANRQSDFVPLIPVFKLQSYYLSTYSEPNPLLRLLEVS